MLTENMNNGQDTAPIVSIWDRLLKNTCESNETDTFKKSAFGKIMKLYHEKRDWALKKLKTVYSSGDIHLLNLIDSKFVDFFARYSSVIFKHEMLFADVPYTVENEIIYELISIAGQSPHLEQLCLTIIGKMLNQAQNAQTHQQVIEQTCNFATSSYAFSQIPSRTTYCLCQKHIHQLAELSGDMTCFLSIMADNWFPTWEEMGILCFLPHQQVQVRIAISKWLKKLSAYIRGKQADDATCSYNINWLAELGFGKDSEPITKDQFLRMLHPDTYAGKEYFSFLFTLL